jgi:diguanylate cyclase (GGDEF)-like protein/PAS domain S-box-containing protein
MSKRKAQRKPSNRGYIRYQRLFACLLIGLLFLLSVCISHQITFAQGSDWLTQEQKDWIIAHPIVTVAPDPHFVPIEYFNERGDYCGMAADYLALVARETGLTFKAITCESWDEALQKVENREVDALPAAAQTEERANYVLFSDPFLVLPGVIITRQEVAKRLTLNDLAHMHVAVVKGYLWQEFISRDHPDVILHLVPDVITGLREASLGIVDAMIATLPVATYYLQQDAITNLKVSGESGYFTRLSFATRNDWPELAAIVQEALTRIPEAEKEAIEYQWIKLDSKRDMSTSQIWLVVGIVSFLAIIGLALALWNLSLKRLVLRKTNQLQASKSRYRALFEQLRDPVFLETLDGRIVDVNHSACEMLGYTRDELLSLTVADLLPDGAPVFGLAQLTTANTDPLQTVNKRKDGKHIHAEISGTMVKIDSQDHLLVSLRDISSRVRDEKIREVLHKISQASSSTDNLGQFFPEIRRILADTIDTTNFRIALYDKDEDKVTIPYLVDKYDTYEPIVGRNTLTTYVTKNGKPMLLRSAQREEWLRAHGLEPVGQRSKAWLGVPLRSRNKVIGAVIVQSYDDENLYSEDDVKLLELAAEQIGIAIERKQAQDALRESEERFRIIYEAVTDAILIFTNDGTITYANNAACKMYGYTREELIGSLAEKLIHPDYFHGFANFRKAVEEKHQFVTSSVNVRSNGEQFDAEIHGAGFNQNGVPFLVSIVLDISERLASERAINESRMKVEQLHNVAQTLQVCSSEDQVYLATINAAEKILSFPLCVLDIVDKDILITKAMSSGLPSDATRQTSLEEGGLAVDTYRTRKTTVFGSLSEVPQARPTREDFKSGISAPIGNIGVFQATSTKENAFSQQDVRLLELLLEYTTQAIERIRLQKQLHDQAMRDPLTNVFNRRYFNQVIESEIGRSERYNHPISFLMMDIDHFKFINDTYGHQTGDCILKAVADLLVEQVRESDLVVRYGGDEFLVVLIETNKETDTVIKRIHQALVKLSCKTKLIPFPVTLSIGAAYWKPGINKTVEEILAEADRSMYTEKRKHQEGE